MHRLEDWQEMIFFNCLSGCLDYVLLYKHCLSSVAIVEERTRMIWFELSFCPEYVVLVIPLV